MRTLVIALCAAALALVACGKKRTDIKKLEDALRRGVKRIESTVGEVEKKGDSIKKKAEETTKKK